MNYKEKVLEVYPLAYAEMAGIFLDIYRGPGNEFGLYYSLIPDQPEMEAWKGAYEKLVNKIISELS
jgi:hypothetical protein